MRMYQKFMVMGLFARNMISKSNKDLSMADVTSERVNDIVLKVHERVLLGQKYVQKVKYGLLNSYCNIRRNQ